LLQEVRATLQSGSTIINQCVAQDLQSFHVGAWFDILCQQSLAITLAHSLVLAARHPDKRAQRLS
jgi:hypothetical protein